MFSSTVNWWIYAIGFIIIWPVAAAAVMKWVCPIERSKMDATDWMYCFFLGAIIAAVWPFIIPAAAVLAILYFLITWLLLPVTKKLVDIFDHIFG